ncbi:MAG: hypothetical protein HY320_01680 [Armatimonadetes bacterium]|nr:hypothetical protein [Armatimonadota bacterium]
MQSLTLDVPDGEAYVTRTLTEARLRLICRKWPDPMVLNRPHDCHRDHRYTAPTVPDTTYVPTVPMLSPDAPHLERTPVFTRWWDRFNKGGAFEPNVVVPSDRVLETKAALAMARASQFFEWLPFLAWAAGPGARDEGRGVPDQRVRAPTLSGGDRGVVPLPCPEPALSGLTRARVERYANLTCCRPGSADQTSTA